MKIYIFWIQSSTKQPNKNEDFRFVTGDRNRINVSHFFGFKVKQNCPSKHMQVFTRLGGIEPPLEDVGDEGRDVEGGPPTPLPPEALGEGNHGGLVPLLPLPLLLQPYLRIVIYTL